MLRSTLGAPPRSGGGTSASRSTATHSLTASRARVLAALLCAVVVLPAAWLSATSVQSLRLRVKIYRLYRAELPRYLPVMEASPTWETDAVPPLLHFLVPSNRSRWVPVWRQCHASWERAFPGHTVRYWDDDDMERLVRDVYPQFARVYGAYTRQIQRADMARYLVLHAHGGIYADSDYQCVRGFAHLLPRGRVSLAESPHSGEIVQNALMASTPRHPFWAYVLRELLANVYVSDVVLSTGPRALLYAFDKAPRRMVTLLPRSRFSRWPGRRVQKVVEPLQAARMYNGSDAIYAVHLGTESWKDAVT